MNKDKAEDLRLITSFLFSGDNRTFDKLVLKYQSPIRRFLLNLTMGDTALSDDLAQETFIKAFRHIHHFNALSGFSTWLFRIAYNVFYDNKRVEKLRIPLESVADQFFVENDTRLHEKIDIFEAVKILKPEERAVILLFFMEDKTHKEIATITGQPLGTVKTHLLRGKEKLSHYFKKEGYGS